MNEMNTIFNFFFKRDCLDMILTAGKGDDSYVSDWSYIAPNTHTDVVPALVQLSYIDASGASRQSTNLIVAVLQLFGLKYILYNTARGPVAITDAT